MDVKSVKSALSAASPFKADIASLSMEYRSVYDYWIFQISNGFNILMHGVGSKRNLLEDFYKQVLSNSCHLVINGFFPGLTVKQILTQLTSEVFGHSGTFKTDIEHAHYIKKALEAKKEEVKGSKLKLKDACQEIFFVIHNIDGPSLRGENSQTCLSILAQSPSIHILASMDHINAPLIWDQKKLCHFNWSWYDTTTYQNYVEEGSYENSILVQQSGSLALHMNSLMNVMRCLTPNARGVFKLLAKYQLESDGTGTYLGMSFGDCYMKCRQAFLVNSDLTLRTQLTEFLDHKLVKSRKGPDGVEYLIIPVDTGTLHQFMEQSYSEE